MSKNSKVRNSRYSVTLPENVKNALRVLSAENGYVTWSAYLRSMVLRDYERFKQGEQEQ